ncbi:maleylpyruvate isomerase N-terminal domain-containing protein [Saccharothrix sp. NRRL B-16348]|uniref:maleylpyruvate isomerase N-terminal domain-containing protein n=1 Tax=Saccharothrix sp. NRRL B-16348 TaxID=1415542 RepID=UPI0009EC30D7|nr:maleylpyruvate isomerase N-terminal domain-containing protein [Saccharothrix sp. NRRL B-16348]
MELDITDRRWQDVRDALTGASERFTRMLLDCRTPDRRTIGDWSVADTAAHVSVVARLNAGLISGDLSPLDAPHLDQGWQEAGFGGFARLNDLTLDHFPERALDVVSNTLLEEVDLLLTRAKDVDPRELRPWLGSAQLPAAAHVAHQLNEILIHGLDIARVLGVPWHISAHEAALTFDLFLMPMLGGRSGRLLAGAGTPGRVTLEFRSKHTVPVVLTSENGRLQVEPADGRKIDARVTFDPAAMMLTVFRRIRLARAVATGKVFAFGRRPWAAVGYLRGMRSP